MLIPKQWARLVSSAFAIFLVVAFLNHLNILRTPPQFFRPSAETSPKDAKDARPYKAEDQSDGAKFEPPAIAHETPVQDELDHTPDAIILEGTRTPDTPTTLEIIASTALPTKETKAPQPDPSSPNFRKTVVMGKLLSEDTDWVSQHVSDWKSAIYVVDAAKNETSPTGLKTKMNKAKEATPYLTFIVEHYDDFPDVAVFLHAHRSGWPQAWHNDAQEYDAVNMLHGLRLNTVLSRGYVNLRCLQSPGCPNEIDLHRSPPDAEKTAEIAYPFVYSQFFNITVEQVREQVPIIASPCCAQFAVSRDQVRGRPKAEYVRFLEVIATSTYDDQTLGTVMEYMWHILFGRDAVYCEDTMSCYDTVYGHGSKSNW